MNRSVRILLQWVPPVIISSFLVSWLLGSAGLKDVFRCIGQARLRSLVFFSTLWILSTLCRSRIYHRLLNGAVSWQRLIPLMWVRSLTVDFLPARGGLASIPAALKFVWDIPVSSGIASITGATAVEISTLGIVVLAALAHSARRLPPGWATALLITAIAVILVLPLVMLLATWLTPLEKKGGVRGWIGRVSRDVATLRRRGIFAEVFGFTLLVRIFKYGGLFILMDALAGSALPPVAFLVAMISAEATSALPVQGLGGVGTWEAAWTEVSTRLGLTRDLAIMSGFSLHLLILAWEILMGGIGLLLLIRMRIRK